VDGRLPLLPHVACSLSLHKCFNITTRFHSHKANRKLSSAKIHIFFIADSVNSVRHQMDGVVEAGGPTVQGHVDQLREVG